MNILALQKALNREGFGPLAEDGLDGPKTQHARGLYQTWTTACAEIIDVSNAQGDINWVEVKRAGILGVYIKATEGMGVDARFASHLAGALSVGLSVGCYHVTHPKNDEVAEAKHFVSTVKAHHGGTLVGLWRPMLDVEVDDASQPESKEQLHTLRAATKAEWGGVDPIVYSYGPFVLGHGLDLSGCLYWHAEYCGDDPPTHISPQSPSWTLHQYAGNDGKCPGVKVACDRTRVRGSIEQLRGL